MPEVLNRYTINTAFFNGMERKVGSLEARKYVDIAVSDRNLFAIPSDKLKNSRTICAVYNDKVVLRVNA